MLWLLYSQGKSLLYHWIGGWVGLRASVDAVAKRKKFLPCPCWELNPSCPAHSLVTILTEIHWVVIITHNEHHYKNILSCVTAQGIFITTLYLVILKKFLYFLGIE
jgi:hypothetical protein